MIQTSVTADEWVEQCEYTILLQIPMVRGWRKWRDTNRQTDRELAIDEEPVRRGNFMRIEG